MKVPCIRWYEVTYSDSLSFIDCMGDTVPLIKSEPHRVAPETAENIIRVGHFLCKI